MKDKPPAKPKKRHSVAYTAKKMKHALTLAARHRELLDTCLQDVQGLLLKFHVVGQAIPKRSRASGLMGEALDRADEVLDKVRDRARLLVR